MNDYILMQTALVELVIVANEHSIIGLYPQTHALYQRAIAENTPASTDILLDAMAQLQQYFAKQRTQFELPLAPQGTKFQMSIWQELQHIPHGTTTNYGEIASRTNNNQAHRAVGTAIGRNPISIIIPCHRVIRSNGSISGYAGGINMKQSLLSHEKNLPYFL
jgi:methylated-DNA-[protein]-cysteine S-methyltransferase